MKSTRWSMRLLTGGLAMALGFTVSGSAAAAPGVMDELVAQRRAQGEAFAALRVFTGGKASQDAALRDVGQAGTILSLDARGLARLGSSAPSSLSLPLPAADGRVVLELVRVDPFAPGFRAVTSDGVEVPARDIGVHYRGVIAGEAGSLAAISVFGREVMGFAQSAARGQLVLGRLGGSNPRNDHVIYRANAKSARPFACGTADSPMETDELISLDRAVAGAGPAPVPDLPGGTVAIYVEADYDMFKALGTSGTTSLVTGVFNQSSTIYANENITIGMSQLLIWTTRSPYKGNSSSQLLASFQKNRTSFNGDLGHLVALRGGGGIAAGFNGLCNPVRSQSQCFSMLDTTYANYPTYSWSVMVFTHEMGHLMGSRHTHACVWNGNNTAIDGCYQVEGTCARPGIPAAGGTIMSYCHLQSVGTNFTNGFGPQPGGVIRDRYNAASCVN